jgi:signal transduction histidine kinase
VTRRILLVLLGFTAVVLVGAVVPLALNTTSHDRSSFIQATSGMARSDALIAEARLEGKVDGPLVDLITESRVAGDGLLILSGRCPGQGTLEDERMPAGPWRQFACQQANQQANATLRTASLQPVVETTGSRVIAGMPVFNLSHKLVGTLILARSTQSLNSEIIGLWIIFGTICVVALLGATLLAFALARWVSRPLAGLDGAAGRLADGDLGSRAVVDSGPPELRRLATTFNTMAGRLEALVHGNRAVIADVSHQLRTPLAALRLRLDLLAADTDPGTGHELAGALEELARLSRLVDGLLAVARAENVVPVPTAVDVAEVARERVVAWHPVADDRGITLEVTARPRTAPAWIGEGHLEQVLDNLIANALEALGAGGHVTVTVVASTAGAQIAVADDGPGMSADDRERAFLRFTTSNPNGTGLGLAIVHRLVTSNGGTARLAETPGGGLTAILEFPGVPAPGSGAPGSGASGGSQGQTVPAQDFISL